MLEIAIDSDEDWDSSIGWEALGRRAAEAAVAESAFPQLATLERAIELSLRLTSDDEVPALNRQWRGKDKPTNVLSFPMLEADDLQYANVAGPELLLGDIVLARGVCLTEAADKGIPLEDHASAPHRPRHAAPAWLRPSRRARRRRHGGSRNSGTPPAWHCQSL